MDQSTETLLQCSFTSDDTTNSSELGYTFQINTSNPDLLHTPYVHSNIPSCLYGSRTRHLSCIEENESDSYNSLPDDLMKGAEDTFKGIFENKSLSWEAEDVDYITTLDESRILDIESYEQLDQFSNENKYWTTDIYGTMCKPIDTKTYFDTENNALVFKNEAAEMSTSTGAPVEKYPKIMTTSCYGGFSDVFQDDINSVVKDDSTNEPIYAVPDKQSKVIVHRPESPEQVSDPKSMTSSLDMTGMKALENNLDYSIISADGSRLDWNEDTHYTANMLTTVNTDLQAIRRLLESETGGAVCPGCHMSFDKGKKRKLIDTCGHERCYSCMFRSEQCPLCTEDSIQSKDSESGRLHGYDTGLGGSTTTIVSPLGSPQPQVRSQQRFNGHHPKFSQTGPDSASPEFRRSSSTKPQKQQTISPRCAAANHSCSEISTSSCATPPQSRRKLFNAKNVRSPFSYGHRRCSSNGYPDTTTLSEQDNIPLESSTCSDSVVTRRRKNVISNLTSPADSKANRLSLAGTSAYAGHLSSLVFNKIKSLWNANSTSSNAGLNQLADDEGGNVKPISLSRKSKSSQDELQTRLGFFLDNNNRGKSRIPTHSCSSVTSNNTSPLSTLTASSEAEISKSSQERNQQNIGSDSIGSLVSVSISGYSNAPTSPASKRNSVAAGNATISSDTMALKGRKSFIRRSARAIHLKDNAELKSRLAQYRSPQLTLKPLFFEVPLQEPDPLFVGRQWILRELSNILTTTETPGVLINGGPGTGKTALILQLVEYSCFGRRKDIPLCENDGIYCQINVGHDRIKALASHVVAYHFCQVDNNSTCLVPDFIHSLAAQLCQAPQLASYREYLINEPHLQNILCLKECIADPKRVMRMAILEPLTILKRAGKISTKNCVILVDALCEAEYHRPDHGYTIASFLGEMTEYFPSWLKVVATVRTQMLEYIKGLAYTKMTLDSWSSNEYLQKDMLEYITFRVNHSVNIQNNIGPAKDTSSGQFKFVTYLLGLTKGSFLYAKLIIDLIERGNLVVKSTSYKVLPVSLAQIFLLHFNLRFPTASSYEKVSQILNICLAALYPLTLYEIYYTVCALNVDEFMEWDEFLQRFKTLSGFLVKRIDNTYMFFHPSFREWLIRRDEGESSKFLCDFRMGHAAIAFRLSRLQVPLNSEQTLELGHHILKAHIYRSSQPIYSPRDIQSYWISSVTESASAALCTLRNVYSPNVKVSRLLLLSGASPHYQTDFMGDATILCIAAYEGIVPMVSLLLEFGADVEKTNSQGCTPLILAAIKGHCDVVRLLVAAGSALGHSDTTQRCALVHAARMGKVNVVKYLLACDWVSRPGTLDISLVEAAQQSLIAAASQDNNTVVEDLLDMSQICVETIDTLTGDTALTAAARNGCTESVSILLTRGACVDTRNKQGCSPLLSAAKEGHWAVVERLLQNSADIEQTEPATKKTSLIIAAEEGHVGIIELLIEKGASMETCDDEGLTALCWACLRGRLQAAKCLLEKGSNKDHTDKAGRTALDLAAYQGSASLVQLLLDKGAKVEHVDKNGMRPLDRAIACRNIQVVQVFLKRGAKLGPATWAMATGKVEILLLLLNKLLEDGNILYRKNRLQEAAYRYQYALRKIPSTDSTSEQSSAFLQIRVNFLLNLSRCKRKLNELAEAIDLATQAIDIKPSHYEGYYARAKSYLEENEMDKALNDAKCAIQKAGNVQSDVKEVLKRLHDEIILRINNTSPDEITDL